MQTIYVYKAETTFGPFFSSLDKVREYLAETELEDERTPEEIEDIIAGRDDYVSILTVELNNTSVEMMFDG